MRKHQEDADLNALFTELAEKGEFNRLFELTDLAHTGGAYTSEHGTFNMMVDKDGRRIVGTDDGAGTEAVASFRDPDDREEVSLRVKLPG